MKDNIKPCQHTLPENEVYKEVIIIGNGPSGLVTSFMLAGNVPYLKSVPDDLPIDDMLRARLANLPEGVSLYDTDLTQLAEGLEGRSQNPIPILMDNLLRPCTDIDIEADPLIEWRYEPDKEIDHLVLGGGPVGGAWPWFPGGVRTLSPARWLWLPPHHTPAAARLPARAVAAYCRRYVHACRIQKYFKCNIVVTSVRPLPRSERCPTPGCPMSAAFCVEGHSVRGGLPYRWRCARVVSCGGASRAVSLGAGVAPHALHALGEWARALRPAGRVLVVGGGLSAADGVALARANGCQVYHLHRAPAPALAALHPHTHPDYCQVYKMMMEGSNGSYEDYTSYPHHVIADVTPLADVPCDEEPILRPKRVTLLDLRTNQTKEITVSLIGVFIGSKPDLSYLQTNTNCEKCTLNKIEEKRYKNHWHYLKSFIGQSIHNCESKLGIDYNKIACEKLCKCDDIQNVCQCENADGIGLGLDPNKPVDSRNPIAIDKSSHEILNAPPGLYALGPLTGDNFVRFIPGGALAIVAHIHKDRLAI